MSLGIHSYLSSWLSIVVAIRYHSYLLWPSIVMAVYDSSHLLPRAISFVSFVLRHRPHSAVESPSTSHRLAVDLNGVHSYVLW